MFKPILSIVLAMLCAAPASVAARPKRPKAGTEVGSVAPAFSGTDTRGQAFALKALLQAPERTAVVLIFAQIDAEQSRREVNDLNKIEREWRKLGVELVHVGIGAKPGDLKAFTRDRSIPWTAIADKRRAIAKKYAVQRVPHLVVIGRDGIIGFISTELSADRYEEIRAALSTVTGQPAPWGAAGGGSTLLHFEHRYTFGRPPSDPGSSVRWQPLAMVIGQASNAYVSMVSADSYEAYERALLAGQYEVANVGPVIAHRILEQYEPVVHLERRKKASYRGIIFAGSDASIRKISHLRGKTLALVSPQSTSGGIFPFAELMQAGLKPEVDVRLLWVGSHTAVAKAVKKGKADAGGCYDDCREGIWSDEAQREAQTHIIGFTDDIPTEVIVVRRDVPEEARRRIRQVLLEAGTWQSLLGQISGGETPISGVSLAREASLRKVSKSLRGVPEAMAHSAEVAAKRAQREARERDKKLLQR